MAVFFSGESYAKVSPWQPRRQRNQTLKRFREDPNCICLMLQTKVRCVGLAGGVNLCSANFGLLRSTTTLG